MIRTITIENFKSIQKLELELGRVNVLIGENGCGKTNILEAIAFAGAAAQGALGNATFVSRGVRAVDPHLMTSAFGRKNAGQYIRIKATGASPIGFDLRISHVGLKDAPSWGRMIMPTDAHHREKLIKLRQQSGGTLAEQEALGQQLWTAELEQFGSIADFAIFCPENSALRLFQGEPLLLPLSTKGEGLFAHLKSLSERDSGALFSEIKDRLTLLDWFENLKIPKNLVAFERSIRIRDRYLAKGALFDQRSANEGFLFLLFYFTLLISPDTPAFFAIDNIDTSLNPKLCTELMRQIIELAKKHKKQVILTTHNPATLDGLDVRDDEQRLLSVSRDIDGHTRARRIGPPKKIEGVVPVPLSKAFVRGYIGGLPKNF